MTLGFVGEPAARWFVAFRAEIGPSWVMKYAAQAFVALRNFTRGWAELDLAFRPVTV
jgi:hypothetical protein